MSTATAKRAGRSNGANKSKVANTEVLRWQFVETVGFPDDDASVLLLVDNFPESEVVPGYRDGGQWRDFHHDTVRNVEAWAAWPVGPVAATVAGAPVEAAGKMSHDEEKHRWACYRDDRWPGVTLEDENDLFNEWLESGCPEWKGGGHD